MLGTRLNVGDMMTKTMIVALTFIFFSVSVELTMKENEEKLKIEVKLHPDVEYRFFPENRYLEKDDYYFDYPVSSEYRIGLLMDPCRSNAPDCCMNIFGSPEYHSLLNSKLEQERVFKYNVLSREDEISSNYFTIDEGGGTVDYSKQRFADDEEIFDLSCISLKNPSTSCLGRNYGRKPSSLVPPCVDNNISLDVLSGCTHPSGVSYKNCVAIAYSSNAFIPLCKTNDSHCGTFVEIHISGGHPDYDERTIISEVRIEQRNVSGFYTTIIPTTFMGNLSKVLCSYSESKLRLGMTVYITDAAPVCCCPPPFSKETRTGSFLCPRGPTANGPFARKVSTIPEDIVLDFLQEQYPFCHSDITSRIDRYVLYVIAIQSAS
jgi:hypothetical protein